MNAFKYIVPLCLWVVAGCTQENIGEDTRSKEILLGIEKLTVDATGTRAAVDKWDNTVVSIAYAFGTPALFDRSLTVTLADDQDKHIQTGMEYPTDDTPAAFVGYHPAKTPNELGIVGYDLSAGDQDVMLSNTLSGKLTDRISDPMKFEHQLTRFTFIMKCKEGSSYPETVHGVRASASGTDKLMTYAHINLGSRLLNFSFPGQVTSSIHEGAVVPESNAADSDLAFDLMLQPGIPVTFEVITLTDIKTFTITDNEVWRNLLDNGGEAGKQYKIRLWFAGEEIMAGGILITDWVNVLNAYGAGTWW